MSNVTAEQVTEFLGDLLVSVPELPVPMIEAVEKVTALLNGCICAECFEPIHMTAWQLWSHVADSTTLCARQGQRTGTRARPLEVEL